MLDGSILAEESYAQKLRSTKLLGVRIDDIGANTLVDMIVASVETHTKRMVVNANVHLINLAQTQPWIKALFDQADVAFCDGTGVQLAVWLLSGRKAKRHTPPEWILPLAKRLANRGATIYWLGGQLDIVQDAAQNLQQQSGLKTCGLQHGYFDSTPGSADNEALLAHINTVKPDVLLVNMGMPLQERWLAENWNHLPNCVAITAGALVDHMAGRVSRPPRWVSDCGLEWLVRLIIEPRRLWKRYLLGLPLFAARFGWSIVNNKIAHITQNSMHETL